MPVSNVVPVSIDGIAPSPPALTLIGAARQADTVGDRWINGAALWPYPRDLPDVFDPCQPASSAGHAKDAGTPSVAEEFQAYNVLEAITCTTRSVRDTAEWQRRVQVALAAYEHWAVEREFWTGSLIPTSPHLSQTAGTTTLNSGAATSYHNGISLLEQHIADKGGDGVIHMRPGVFSLAAAWDLIDADLARGVARTKLGTRVVPGVGYTGSAPDGTPPAATAEWAFATGPIEVRRSPAEILPGSMAEATNRALNLTTFRAEKYVLVTWDQRIHAAVKIDRAFTTFTS